MSTWPDHLAARFGKEQPRKILALDGGGIRGVLTLEILAEMERQIASATGIARLGEYFDYIGGTSTGSIIAAGLAVGMSAAELLKFYDDFGAQMFEKTGIFQRLTTLASNLYKDEPIAAKLRELYRADPADATQPEADLASRRLKCLLLVVTRNMTTDSPWPISTNPFAKYNDASRDDCNLRIPLWQLVRASTAAPVFFPPEVVRLNPKKPQDIRVFVDGGITPYNNPALHLFLMATVPEYKLAWPVGEENLLVVSIGTGISPEANENLVPGEMNLLYNAASLPSALMSGALYQQDLLCRVLGKCLHGDKLDREIGDLRGDSREAGTSKQFTYLRYNAELTNTGLAGLDLKDIDPNHVQQLDSIAYMSQLRRVGEAVGHQVSDEHFPMVFNC